MPQTVKPAAGLTSLIFYSLIGAGAVYLSVKFLWKDSKVLFWVFFPLGILFLVGAIHHTLEWMKYGNVELDLEATPYPGGKLVALLRTPSGAGGARKIAATLRCKYRYWESREDTSGNETRSITTDTVYERKGEFPVALRLGKTQCRIEFDIPNDAQSSTSGRDPLGGQTVGYFWELDVHADVPGLDLMRAFVIPVGVRPPGKMAA